MKIIETWQFSLSLKIKRHVFFVWAKKFSHDNLNGVVVGYADCYSKGSGFESRVSHGPFQKV
jgi:hypothetical protein